MAGHWLALTLVAILIVVNAVLAGSEMALVSLRPGQIAALGDRGRRGRRVVELVQHPNRYLGALQLGITFAGFLASAAAAVSLSDPVAEWLSVLDGYAEPVAVGLVTVVIALVSLVLGEMVPKRLAMQRAESWSLAVAPLLTIFIASTRPLLSATGWLTDQVVRLFRGNPSQPGSTVTSEEILALVDAEPTITDDQSQIVRGVVEVADRTIGQIMTPRTMVVTLDSGQDAAAALAVLTAAGRSRAPVVVGGALDVLVGHVHVRDLGDCDGAVSDCTKPILALPETLTVLRALRQLQLSRTTLAVVVDEFGGSEGIVTVEDLIEELVGEIYDETDPDLQSVDRDGSGRLTLPGQFPVHDLPDVGIDLPVGPYATVAGLILGILGRIPEAGEIVYTDAYRLDVLAVEHHAITRVRITPRQGSATE